jgi:UDP-N-acetylglucosamine 2-epimerase (non-hydrolysing)
VVFTAQHRDLVEPVLRFFDIVPDVDLDLMRHAQDPSGVMARVLEAITPIYRERRPERVIVQGDTTTALAAAMAAHHLRIPVGHVEAGLRTGNRYDPFPEEMNRRLITRLADLHFAATEGNRATLLAEGVDDASIVVTGNPIIDALNQIRASAPPALQQADRRRRIVLTAHRRENFGEPLAEIFRAVNTIVERFDDVEVVYPMHPNPAVAEAAGLWLRTHPRLRVVAPMDYIEFVRLMAGAYMILTDSGGIQEEAPALGVPILVMRSTTEREEVIRSGNGRLVGIAEQAIVDAAAALLENRDLHASMSRPSFPFGSGDAARKIVEALTSAQRQQPEGGRSRV